MIREQMKARLEAADLGSLDYGPDESGQGYHVFPYDSDSAIAHVDDMRAASLFANAPADLAKLHAALDAVEGLHKPVDSGDSRVVGPVCQACSDPDERMFYFHPCPTVEALRDALGEEAP